MTTYQKLFLFFTTQLIISNLPIIDGGWKEKLKTSVIPSTSKMYQEPLKDSYDLRNDNNFANYYKTYVYMIEIRFKHESLSENHKHLLSYLKQAFAIDDETHSKTLDDVYKIKPRDKYLDVEVIEAQNLKVKDLKANINPYCSFHLKSDPFTIYKTSKSPIFPPIWQEHFQLPLQENDKIYFKIKTFKSSDKQTDSDIVDAAEIKNSKIKSVVQKITQDKIFFGECEIKLKDNTVVPTETIWCDIKKNQKPQRGKIKLKISFNSELNDETAGGEYKNLIHTLLNYEKKKNKIPKYSWLGKWSSESETLINYHSSFRGLLTRIKLLIEWIEFTRIHQQFPLNYKLFNKLLIELKRPLENDLFTKDEEKLFWDSAKSILLSCLKTIKDLRIIKEERLLMQVDDVFAILSTLLSFPKTSQLFPSEMFPWFPENRDNDVSILKALEYSIEAGAVEWLNSIKNEMGFSLSSENIDESINHCIKLIKAIESDMNDSNEIQKDVKKNEIPFSYSQHLYNLFSNEINNICLSVIGNVNAYLSKRKLDDKSPLSQSLLEFYLTIRSYYTPFAPDKTNFKLNMENYQKMFRNIVPIWLSTETNRGIKRIEIAVEIDKFDPENVQNDLKHSSSAVDVSTIIYQLKNFKEQLKWFDADDSYSFIVKIIDETHRYLNLYIKLMTKKIEVTNDFKKWTILINNINFVQSTFKKFIHELKVEEIFDEFDKQKLSEAVERYRGSFQSISKNINQNMQHKIIVLLEKLSNKIQTVVDKNLMRIYKSNDIENDVIGSSIDYLNFTVKLFHKGLNGQNFQDFLRITSEKTFKTLYKFIYLNLQKKTLHKFFSHLKKFFEELLELFHLEDYTNQLEVVINTKQLLDFYSLETPELIKKYYYKRYEKQKKPDTLQFGELIVHAFFKENSININVAQLKIKNCSLKTCNPFIKIKLLPKDQFNGMKLKTLSKKNSTSAEFDENFLISLNAKQRGTKDSLVAFNVMNKKWFKETFLAEAFLPFDKIPETKYERSFRTFESIHLKLLRPTKLDNLDVIVQILKQRKKDNTAKYFISELRKKIK